MVREQSDPIPAGGPGSSPVGGADPQRSRGKLGGLVLAAVVVLVLLALLLSRCGSKDDPSSSSTSTSGSSTSASTSPSVSSTGSGTSGSSGASAAVTPAGPAAVTPGTVTDGTRSSLDATGSADPATALAALSGRPVTAVQELSVPADEGFRVGASDTARVRFQLTRGGESGHQVDAGDTFDPVTLTAGFRLCRPTPPTVTDR